MAKGRIASFEMELRNGVADGVLNGRNYDDVREYLRTAGVGEADLPSDHSLRTYQESVEYRSLYQQRKTACNLRFTAGSMAGCASARVEIIQNEVVEQMESWLKSGLLELADLYKIAGFTLQFQRQQLAERRTRHLMGQSQPVEHLGTREMPAAEFDAVMQEVLDRMEQENEALRAAEEQEAAELEAAAAATQDDGGLLRKVEDSGGKPRILEDNRGKLRIMEDASADDADADDDAEALADAECELAMAVGESFSSSGTAGEAKAQRPRPVFKNSPSRKTRQKARKRRKKH
jgi:hypothetical protein